MNAMPVRMPVAEQDSVGPYNRMSASQANTYESCPRLWFYQKVYRFKMPQIPVLFVGRAVEEAVCRVLRESPGFVVASSSPAALEASPYKEDGAPISAVERQWPASGLMPLFPNERPQSLDDLTAWAFQRGRHHLPPALERMRTLWENDERRSGDWAEVDQERCLEMVLNALRFHRGEVERCRQAGGGPGLDRWRRGERGPWPSPDGFPYESFPGPHPLAGDGDM